MLSRDFLEKAKGLMTQLTGDPAYIEGESVDVSEEEEEEEGDKEEEEVGKEELTDDERQKTKKVTEDSFFREIHRLAFIIKVR